MFRKNSDIENFQAKEGGSFTVLSKKILSHRTEKIFRENHSVFQKIFGGEKKLWIRGGISRFSVEIFLSHSAEKSRKGILLFLRKFLVAKSFMDEKEGHHVFPSKIFCLTVPRNFVEEPISVSPISGIKKC